MEYFSRLKNALLLLGLIICCGIFGYMFIEGWHLIDAIYMVAITLTTVGFGEVHPLSTYGKIFTVFVLLGGVGAVGYILGSLAEMMIEGHIGRALGRRKLEKRIESLKNHYIICGFGRMGGFVCDELSREGIPFVVIEKDPEKGERLEEKGYLYIRADATSEEVMIKAGIKRAKGIATLLSSDADNLFITLSARDLNPSIYILSRAEEEGSEKKLLRAGADKVFYPHRIGASRIAQAIIRPSVLDFIEITTADEKEMVRMEELVVGKGSPIAGKSIKDSGIRRDFGVMVVGIRRKDGTMIIDPPPDEEIKEGDILITIGKVKNMKQLEKLTSGS